MSETKVKLWMGIREYARHRGISHMAVQKQIKAKLLTINNGALKETKNQNRVRVWINSKLSDAIWSAEIPASPNNAHSNHTGHQENKLQGPSYAQSRSIKEAFSARLAQLDYEKKSGELCRTEDVAKSAKDMARLTRDYLLNMPGKLAPLLAAETNIDEVHKIIEDEIHNALTNLSSGKIF